MTIREEVQNLINASPTLHREAITGAEQVLAEEVEPRALSHAEVEHYRLWAKVTTLTDVVLFLADEVDRLRRGV